MIIPFKNWLDFYGQEGVVDACLTVYFDLVAKYSERLSADEQKEVIRVFLEVVSMNVNSFKW